MKYDLNEPKEKLGSPLVAVLKELNEMAKHIKFSYDNRLGFITSSPFYLGTGIQLFLKLKLKNLESDDVAKMMEEKETYFLAYSWATSARAWQKDYGETLSWIQKEKED